MARPSRTRLTSAIALFVALAVVLNLTVYFPAPYAPFLNYEVWEIPIVLALLMYGLRAGVTVAVLNTLVLELHAGPLPTGPFYNLFAVLSMFLGVLIAGALSRKMKFGTPTLAASATVLGASIRVGIMTVVNATVLPLPYPLGFSLPPDAIPPLLVVIAIFNGTVALYTVPASYLIHRKVLLRYRIFQSEGAVQSPAPTSVK